MLMVILTKYHNLDYISKYKYLRTTLFDHPYRFDPFRLGDTSESGTLDTSAPNERL